MSGTQENQIEEVDQYGAEIHVMGRRGDPVSMVSNSFDPRTSWVNDYFMAMNIQAQALMNAVSDNVSRHNSQWAVNQSSNHSAEMSAAIAAAKVTAENLVTQATYQASQPGGNQEKTIAPSYMGSAGQAESIIDQIDLFSRIQFDIVDTPSTAGRGGANHGVGPDGLMHIQINSEAFLNYFRMDTNPQNQAGQNSNQYSGLNHLFAHEMAHKTVSGTNFDEFMWTSYLSQQNTSTDPAQQLSAYDRGNIYFDTNERYTNTFADTLLKQYHQDGLVTPPGGYLFGYDH